MQKFGALWEDVDLKKPFAVFFKPLKYLVKLLFVLNLFLFADAPLIQIYVSVAI